MMKIKRQRQNNDSRICPLRTPRWSGIAQEKTSIVAMESCDKGKRSLACLQTSDSGLQNHRKSCREGAQLH